LENLGVERRNSGISTKIAKKKENQLNRLQPPAQMQIMGK